MFVKVCLALKWKGDEYFDVLIVEEAELPHLEQKARAEGEEAEEEDEDERKECVQEFRGRGVGCIRLVV